MITGVKVKGETKTSAISVFENFALFKRNQPPNKKNQILLSSLLVVWMYFARSFDCLFSRLLCTKIDFGQSKVK